MSEVVSESVHLKYSTSFSMRIAINDLLALSTDISFDPYDYTSADNVFMTFFKWLSKSRASCLSLFPLNLALDLLICLI
jgi:hypothetical protein